MNEYQQALLRIIELEDKNAELLGVLEELAVLMDATRDGDYTPDSFTTQPAKQAIRKGE